ncbi:MAG: hypothetical protein LBM75_00620 [Myxococcales bacterium]|jgi:hypothetical protein|nr:hypothetical protein [Myxococcales bacterium]
MSRIFGKKSFAIGSTALALSIAAVLGCQTFEMDKVDPKAEGHEHKEIEIQGKMDKSFIMLVIDKSGSMLYGVTDPIGCKSSGALGYDRTKDCRWNSLLDAFAGTPNGSDKGFLRKSQDSNDGEGSALFGLATYPADNTCGAGNVDVSLATSDDNVQQIIDQLNSIPPAGGTPTAPTLDSLLEQDVLLNTSSKTQKRFVMLLTDGSPNCNASAENAARCQACNDTGTVEACNDLSSSPIACYPTNTPAIPGTGNRCDIIYQSSPHMFGTDCLDKDHSVEAIQKLRDAGVETFVIGFGNTGADPATKLTLNEMALAGGRPVGEEGDDIRFYEATDTGSLNDALDAILRSATGCIFQLDPLPRSCDNIQINLETVATGAVRKLEKPTEWDCTPTYDDNGVLTAATVEIKDTPQENICSDKLVNSPAGTYKLQFFYSMDL